MGHSALQADHHSAEQDEGQFHWTTHIPVSASTSTTTTTTITMFANSGLFHHISTQERTNVASTRANAYNLLRVSSFSFSFSFFFFFFLFFSLFFFSLLFSQAHSPSYPQNAHTTHTTPPDTSLACQARGQTSPPCGWAPWTV